MDPFPSAPLCRAARIPSPLIWTYHPFVLETLTGLDYSKLVYHNVDDLAAIPGIGSAAFKAEEKRLLSVADAVFTQAKRSGRNAFR